MHLFGHENDCLLGIDTAYSFQAVIDAVRQQNIAFDIILATGDLSQDYSYDSYKRFAEMVKQLEKPVFWLPGNHDDGPLMRRIMPEFGVSIARNIIIGEWQFIMLNTQVYSVPHGWILPDQHELKNKNELLDLVYKHPQVKLVLCGHVHQETDFVSNNVRFISSPSTSIQFEPLSFTFGGY